MNGTATKGNKPPKTIPTAADLICGSNNEAIIAAVPEIAISSGASCTTSSRSASHVLVALGLSKNEAFCSLRFGIGRFNSKQEILTATKIICNFLSGHQ